MSKEFLRDRERALEDSFFFERDKELLNKIKQEGERSTEKDALKMASGISDDTVLDDLLNAGISAKTVASLALVPLVVVAWADRVIAPQEQAAILKGAHDAGMKEGDPAYELLNSWLAEQPDDSLFNVWKEYIQAISKEIGPEGMLRLKEDISGRIHKIAKVAGGILGLGKVNVSERQAMKDIESAFEVR